MFCLEMTIEYSQSTKTLNRDQKRLPVLAPQWAADYNRLDTDDYETKVGCTLLQ